MPDMPIIHEMLPKRMVIYAKDIENITGRKERTARRMLQKIRQQFNKKEGEFITVKEFCLFTGLNETEVKTYLLY